MNKDELQKMVSLIDDVYLEEALCDEKGTKRGKFGSKKTMRAAAIVAAVVGIAAGGILLRQQPDLGGLEDISRTAENTISGDKLLVPTRAAVETPTDFDFKVMGGGVDSFDREYRDEAYSIYCCGYILGNEVVDDWVNNVYLKKPEEERNKTPDLYQAVHELGITKEQLMNYSEEMRGMGFGDMGIDQSVIDSLYLEDLEEMRKNLTNPFSLYYKGEIYTMSEILNQSGTQQVPPEVLVSFIKEKKEHILELYGEAEYKKVYEPSINAILKKENVDYKSFFVDASGGAQRSRAIDYTLEQGGAEYRYEGADSMPGLPFSIDGFNYAKAHVYYDKEEICANCLLQLENAAEEKYLGITISRSGAFYSCYAIDEEKGVERFGTTVYGFDLSTFSDRTSLELYFRHDGFGYGIASSGLSYEEMGEIMDSILLNGLNEDVFDRAKGIKCTRECKGLMLEEACKLPTFAGFVPNTLRVGSIGLSGQDNRIFLEEGAECGYYINYENDVVAYEGLDIVYENKDYAYIMASFCSGSVPEHENSVILLKELNEQNVLKYEYPSDRRGAHWYSFTIADAGRYVHISANCTREEILEYIQDIIDCG